MNLLSSTGSPLKKRGGGGGGGANNQHAFWNSFNTTMDGGNVAGVGGGEGAYGTCGGEDEDDNPPASFAAGSMIKGVPAPQTGSALLNNAALAANAKATAAKAAAAAAISAAQQRVQAAQEVAVKAVTTATASAGVGQAVAGVIPTSAAPGAAVGGSFSLMMEDDGEEDEDSGPCDYEMDMDDDDPAGTLGTTGGGKSGNKFGGRGGGRKKHRIKLGSAPGLFRAGKNKQHAFWDSVSTMDVDQNDGKNMPAAAPETAEAMAATSLSPTHLSPTTEPKGTKGEKSLDEVLPLPPSGIFRAASCVSSVSGRTYTSSDASSTGDDDSIYCDATVATVDIGSKIRPHLELDFASMNSASIPATTTKGVGETKKKGGVEKVKPTTATTPPNNSQIKSLQEQELRRLEQQLAKTVTTRAKSAPFDTTVPQTPAPVPKPTSPSMVDSKSPPITFQTPASQAKPPAGKTPGMVLPKTPQSGPSGGGGAGMTTPAPQSARRKSGNRIKRDKSKRALQQQQGKKDTTAPTTRTRSSSFSDCEDVSPPLSAGAGALCYVSSTDIQLRRITKHKSDELNAHTYHERGRAATPARRQKSATGLIGMKKILAASSHEMSPRRQTEMMGDAQGGNSLQDFLMSATCHGNVVQNENNKGTKQQHHHQTDEPKRTPNRKKVITAVGGGEGLLQNGKFDEIMLKANHSDAANNLESAVHSDSREPNRLPPRRTKSVDKMERCRKPSHDGELQRNASFDRLASEMYSQDQQPQRPTNHDRKGSRDNLEDFLNLSKDFVGNYKQSAEEIQSASGSGEVGEDLECSFSSLAVRSGFNSPIKKSPVKVNAKVIGIPATLMELDESTITSDPRRLSLTDEPYQGKQTDEGTSLHLPVTKHLSLIDTLSSGVNTKQMPRVRMKGISGSTARSSTSSSNNLSLSKSEHHSRHNNKSRYQEQPDDEMSPAAGLLLTPFDSPRNKSKPAANAERQVPLC